MLKVALIRVHEIKDQVDILESVDLTLALQTELAGEKKRVFRRSRFGIHAGNAVAGAVERLQQRLAEEMLKL